MNTLGALQVDFPTSASTVPSSTFNNAMFQKALADFLESASTEPVWLFAATARKAGASPIEPRNTTNPALISDFLITILQGLGNDASPPTLRKHIRDEVCWTDAKEPWRRSPLWLVLRVGLHKQLCTLFGEEGVVYYKFIIGYLLSRLLRSATSILNPEKAWFLKSKLCRRMAKLETARLSASGELAKTYDTLFNSIGMDILAEANDTATRITNVWNHWKFEQRRKIVRLDRLAPPADLQMTLNNSKSDIHRILCQYLYTQATYACDACSTFLFILAYTSTIMMSNLRLEHRHDWKSLRNDTIISLN
jgi:hypothetical protein